MRETSSTLAQKAKRKIERKLELISSLDIFLFPSCAPQISHHLNFKMKNIFLFPRNIFNEFRKIPNENKAKKSCFNEKQTELILEKRAAENQMTDNLSLAIPIFFCQALVHETCEKISP